MTPRREPYLPTPRIWNQTQVAARLGHGKNWLRPMQTRLEAQGFPLFDHFLGGWDADAIELWMDRRSGMTDEAAIDTGFQDRLKALANG